MLQGKGAEPITSLQTVITTNYVVVTNIVIITNYVIRPPPSPASPPAARTLHCPT